MNRWQGKSVILAGILLILFIIGCSLPQEQATTIVQEESTIFSPENFTLVGFWKIEQKFLIDEEKSTENNMVWVEVPVPREKYEYFREYGDNCQIKNDTQFLEVINAGYNPNAYDIDGVKEIKKIMRPDRGVVLSPDVIEYPPLTMIPSPALASGFFPGGVCYFHDVYPGSGQRELSTPQLFFFAMFGNITEFNLTEFNIKEVAHSYNFSENKLEMITSYLDRDFNQLRKRTILTSSALPAAQADGWPYS